LTRLFFAYILSSFFLSLPFVLIYNSFFILHFVRQNHPCRFEFVKTKHFGGRKQFYFENLQRIPKWLKNSIFPVQKPTVFKFVKKFTKSFLLFRTSLFLQVLFLFSFFFSLLSVCVPRTQTYLLRRELIRCCLDRSFPSSSSPPYKKEKTELGSNEIPTLNLECVF